MEDIVVTLHKQIIKSMSKDDRDRFNDIFRQMIALQSPSEILRGLTYHKKLVVLRDSLAEFDTQKLQNDSTHLPVYTFVTKAAFNSLIATAKLKSSTKPIEAAKQATKNVTTDVDTPVLDVSTVEAKLREVSVTQPKPKGVTKPKQVKLPTGNSMKAVYTDLTTYLGTDLPPYKHVHYIDCKHTRCSFTRTLFTQVALTKCVGHKKCVPSGWFPHVGMTLWKSLASKHTELSIFKAKTRVLKDNEMQPLAVYLQDRNSSSSVMDTEQGYDSDCSTITTKSDTSTSSKRSSPSSRASPKRSKPDTSEWQDTNGLDLSSSSTWSALRTKV